MNSQSQNMGGNDSRAKVSLPPMRLYPSSPADLIYPGRTIDRAQAGVSTSHADHSQRYIDRYNGTREVTSEDHRYVHPSDNNLRPTTIAANPSHGGGMVDAIAYTNKSASGSGTMGGAVQGLPPHKTPEAHNIAFALTPTAGNMGNMTGVYGGAHMVSSHLQPHAHTQVPNNSPIIIRRPPESLPRPRGLHVPLPADTDPDFKIDIIVSGRVGFHLMGRSRTNMVPRVASVVDNAAMSLEDIIEDNGVYLQRVYYASERTQMAPRKILIRPQRTYQFILGHLISMLLTMQYTHWRDLEKDERTLHYLIGRNGGLPQGTMLEFSDLCATAIRRRPVGEAHRGMWCYFLQLDVRIR
ncbi:hypothetical protein GY45DRAFT_205046 [Cubamyces sp. BRFM 1775]|nr:hypothetical protein GY45DRAFT_205046 [Cubamyces sp. BRFM 1775]